MQCHDHQPCSEHELSVLSRDDRGSSEDLVLPRRRHRIPPRRSFRSRSSETPLTHSFLPPISKLLSENDASLPCFNTFRLFTRLICWNNISLRATAGCETSVSCQWSRCIAFLSLSLARRPIRKKCDRPMGIFSSLSLRLLSLEKKSHSRRHTIPFHRSNQVTSSLRSIIT